MLSKVCASMIVLSLMLHGVDVCNKIPLDWCNLIEGVYGFCHVEGGDCVGLTNMDFCFHLNNVPPYLSLPELCANSLGICNFDFSRGTCGCALSNCDVNLVNPCALIPTANCTETATERYCKMVNGVCTVQDPCNVLSADECDSREDGSFLGSFLGYFLYGQHSCIFNDGQCRILDPCRGIHGNCVEESEWCKGTSGHCVLDCTSVPADYCKFAYITSFCHIDGATCVAGPDPFNNHQDPFDSSNNSFSLSVPMVAVFLGLLLLFLNV